MEKERRRQEVDDRITVTDFRNVGLCVSGQRSFARERGIDFRDFIDNGMAIEQARELNPGATEKILARRERQRG